MRDKDKNKLFDNLPACVAGFVKLVIKKMRYRKKVRADVQAELIAHFEDALKDCAIDEEKEQKAEKLIADFGDAKLLGILARRAKRRCRPMWQKVLVRGLTFVLCLPAIFWGLTMLYSVVAWYTWTYTDVDYLERLNKLNRPQAADVSNAWQYYSKAIELYVAPPREVSKLFLSSPKDCQDCNEFTENQDMLLRKWLADNELALEQVALGADLEHYWRSISGVSEKAMDKNYQVCESFRNLAYLGIWRIEQYRTQQNASVAFQECLTLIKVGKHLQSSKLTPEYLTGTSITGKALRTLLAVLTDRRYKGRTLDNLQRELEDFYKNCSRYDPQGEMLYSLAMIQSMITESEAVSKWSGVGLGFVCGTRKGAEELLAQRIKENTKQATPYQKYLQKGSPDTKPILPWKFVVEILVPPLQKLLEQDYRARTEYEAAMTIVALLRYNQDSGNYPASLDELVTAGYLKDLPMDPYSDGPLVYKKTEGNFVLYSVGLNFKDDGGEVFEDRKCGRKWGTEDNGDAVFWPVGEPK